MSAAQVYVRSGVVSLVGARDNNEDAYFLRDSDVRGGPTLAQLAVADGMGGHAGGEVASRLAVEGAAAGLGDEAPDSEAIQRVFHEVDQRIRDYADANAAGRSMGTTLTVALVHQSEAVIGHVGDSRAWLLHDGALQQITSDHSRIGRLLRAGAISEQDAIGHPEANVLEQALGAGDRPEVDIYRAGIAAGDILLLSTDGLHGALGREEIEVVLQGHASMQEACDRLAALALERGSSDNITVVAWQYPRSGPRTRTIPGFAPLRAPVAAPARSAPGGPADSAKWSPTAAPSPSVTRLTSRPGGAGQRRDERLPLLFACLAAGFLIGFLLGLMR